MSRFVLADSQVLITGAARGMGLGMAREFASAGARLILWDVDGVALSEVADDFLADGVRIRWDVVDVTDREAIEAAASRVLAEDGPVDVLVNNAGVVVGKTLMDLSAAEIERVFGVNTLALFWTTRAFLPGMIERGSGHVVTVASAAGLAGTPRLVDYCASKFAAVGFDEALRTELASLGHRIGTTVVCPFYVDTGMFEGAKARVPVLLPVLKPSAVVRRTVRAVQRGHHRVLMPRFAYLVYPMRLLPVSWFDKIAGWLGITRSMEGFRGRN